MVASEQDEFGDPCGNAAYNFGVFEIQTVGDPSGSLRV